MSAPLPAWDAPSTAPVNRVGVDRAYPWVQRHDPQGRQSEPAPRVWTPVPTPTPTFEERVAASRARTTADPFCRIRR